MLDEISNMTELDLSTIDAIAVAGGPGLVLPVFASVLQQPRDLVWHLKNH